MFRFIYSYFHIFIIILCGQVSKGGEEVVVQELQSPQVGFKISHHCGFDKNDAVLVILLFVTHI